MKRYGRLQSIITDRLRLYRAAVKVIGNEVCQETGRWLNNRAENSHQPFRRRERATAKFRDAKTLQKFVAVHTSIHNQGRRARYSGMGGLVQQPAAPGAHWKHPTG